VSQRRLAELLAESSPMEATAVGAAAFLTSGWYAVPGSLREEDDFARQCVLDQDIDELLARKKRRAPTDDLLLPVPKGSVMDLGDKRPSELPPWLGVARASDYSTTLGFIASSGSKED
jgi:CRISPR-associated endonuclease/helicase Cas3